MVKKTLKKNNKNISNLSGGSNVWSDLLKMSIIPSTNIKQGGKHNKKTLKNNLCRPIGNRNVNKILEGGFIRGGSTQYFPVNCTRLDNQPSQIVKQEGGNFKRMIGGTDEAEIDSAKELSRLILTVGGHIKNSFAGKINVAIDIFKEYIKEILNAAEIVSVNVEDINDELIKKNGYEYQIDTSFGQAIDTKVLNQFNLLYYVIQQSVQDIDVTKPKIDASSHNDEE